MTLTNLRGETLILAQPLIDDLQAHVLAWCLSGRAKEGDRFSHLLYFGMSPEERAQFHEQLNGYPIPKTSYTLEWIPGFNYFEITLTSP